MTPQDVHVQKVSQCRKQTQTEYRMMHPSRQNLAEIRFFWIELYQLAKLQPGNDVFGLLFGCCYLTSP